LLRQARGIRHSAAAIGVGVAALDRHWHRRVSNRNSLSAFGPFVPLRGTADPESDLSPFPSRRPVCCQVTAIETPAGACPIWFEQVADLTRTRRNCVAHRSREIGTQIGTGQRRTGRDRAARPQGYPHDGPSKTAYSSTERDGPERY
jgi:hypothetical protein